MDQTFRTGEPDTQETESQILSVLSEFVSPDSLTNADNRTELLNHFQELDSMALAEFVTALEEHFGIIIDDEDMTEENFRSIGSLSRLVADRQADA